MPKYGMVIDLQKCAGCGACGLACKTENNTQDAANGQSFNWADYQIEEGGAFPNPSYTCRPVLCNHCTNAACVEACPVTPKAMFKSADGITMHNDERCIGCRSCQEACPYSASDVKGEVQYSVISYNADAPHERYRNKDELIKGGTTSGAEVAMKVGATPPHRTDYQHPEYQAVRKGGIVEKCIFCAHRVMEGKLPYCVESCPSGARIFGDLNDKDSAPSKALAKHPAQVLKPEAGTKPNVYYIRSFKA